MSRQNRIKPYLSSVLLDFGGSAEVSLIRKEIERRMLNDNNLTCEDMEMTSGQPKWENSLRALRESWVKDDILKDDSLRGIWELTDKGREKAKYMSEEN